MNPRYERWRLQTFGITWLVYVSYYLTRQVFGVAKVALAKDSAIGLTREQLGRIDITYLIMYSVGQFFFGPLADRFGPRKVLMAGMLFSALVAAGNGFATTLAMFLAFAVLQGVAQSTGWTATNKAMSAWFSQNERGRVIGWWCTHYAAGAAIGGAFAGFLMDRFSYTVDVDGKQTVMENWPAAYWGAAAALAAVAVLMWTMLRDRPEDVGLEPIEKYHGEPETLLDDEERGHVASEGSWKLIGEVFSSPSIWMLALAYFPVKLTRYALVFWGPSFVNESLGTKAFASAMTSACMPIGGLVGVVAAGYFSDRLFQRRRAPVIILAFLATAAVIVIALWRIDSIWVMGAFFFLVGLFLYAGDSMIAATAAVDYGTKRGAGAATGFVNGVGSLGAVLGAYLPGRLTTSDDWTLLFKIALIGMIISAVILLPLWRHKPPTA